MKGGINTNHEKFMQLADSLLCDVMNTLEKKHSEYADDADHAHNFKIAGAFLGVQPESALLGMWTKHIISVRDIVKHVEDTGKLPFDEDKVKEKAIDMIAYTLLLYATLIERISE